MFHDGEKSVSKMLAKAAGIERARCIDYTSGATEENFVRHY